MLVALALVLVTAGCSHERPSSMSPGTERSDTLSTPELVPGAQAFDTLSGSFWADVLETLWPPVPAPGWGGTPPDPGAQS
jgi:hypothetical protein